MNGERGPVPITVSVLIKQIEPNQFRAHALDLDIVCESSTAEDSLDKLVTAVKAYVQYAVTNDQLPNLLHGAPIEYWKEFDAIDGQFRKRPIAPVAQNTVTMFWAMMNANRLASPAAQGC